MEKKKRLIEFFFLFHHCNVIIQYVMSLKLLQYVLQAINIVVLNVLKKLNFLKAEIHTNVTNP